MGRLIPVFEEQDGRMLFQGKFKDENSGKKGYLEVGLMSPDVGVSTKTEAHFVSTPQDNRS